MLCWEETQAAASANTVTYRKAAQHVILNSLRQQANAANHGVPGGGRRPLLSVHGRAERAGASRRTRRRSEASPAGGRVWAGELHRRRVPGVLAELHHPHLPGPAAVGVCLVCGCVSRFVGGRLPRVLGRAFLCKQSKWRDAFWQRVTVLPPTAACSGDAWARPRGWMGRCQLAWLEACKRAFGGAPRARRT